MVHCDFQDGSSVILRLFCCFYEKTTFLQDIPLPKYNLQYSLVWAHDHSFPLAPSGDGMTNALFRNVAVEFAGILGSATLPSKANKTIPSK